MKVVNFNEKEYQVPESWNEVTIRMVIKVDQLSDLLPDAPIIAIISGYVGIPVDELKVSKIPEVNQILNLMSFIYEPYQAQMSNGFIFKDENYEMKSDISEHEFQDWVSVQTTIYNNRDNPVFALPRILAILAKKSGETLDDINIDERAEYFMDLPYSLAKNLEVFFSTSVLASRAVILLSSTLKEQRIKILQQFLELSNIMKTRAEQPGISFFMRWQIGIWRWYLLYLRKRLERYYNSGVSELSKRNFIRTVKSSYLRLLKVREKDK